jgi:putative copper resistance protein D
MNLTFEITHAVPTFLDLMAIPLVIGSAWVQLWGVRPVDGKAMAFPPLFQLRGQRLIMICLVTLIVSTLGGVVLRGMEMTGLGLRQVSPALPTILLKTHYGDMIFLRVEGLAAAWVVWGINRGRSRLGALLMLAAGMTIAFSRSDSGHLADFGDLSIQQLGDWLHLLAVSCWAGSIMALAYILAPSRVGGEGVPPRFVAGLADRFYLLFGPLLTVLVFTGFYSARFTVGSLEAMASGPYGWLFSAKLALVLILIFRFIAPPEHGRDEEFYVMTFLRRLRVHAWLVIAVLLCVSALVHRIPARHQAHLAAASLAGRHGDSHEYAESQVGEQPLVSLKTNPVEVRAGSPVSMTVTIKDPHGAPLHGLTIVHDRILHAVIVGKDLAIFAHIHPEDLGPITEEMMAKATYPLSFTFPKPGEYLLGLDFATAERAYSKSVTLEVKDAEPMGIPAFDFSTQKNFGDYRVTLTTMPERIVPGQEARLTYHIEKGGQPVTDLAPYLGAPMHIAVVTSDLKRFIHAHGTVPGQPHHDHLHAAPPPERFGPDIESEIVFPEPGVYKLFSQTQHREKVLLFDFMLEVR